MRIIPFLILAIFISCNSHENNEETSSQKRKRKNSELINKYNCKLIDESAKTFSYILYNEYIQNKKYGAIEGEISDILILDSLIYLDISANIDNKVFFTRCKITSVQFEKLKYSLNSDEYQSKNGLFIIKINSMSVNNLGLEISANEDSEPDFYTYDETLKTVIFKGELIDFNLRIDN